MTNTEAHLLTELQSATEFLEEAKTALINCRLAMLHSGRFNEDSIQITSIDNAIEKLTIKTN